MRLVKKIIRKLYHLIWFLSIILFIPNVNAQSYTLSFNGMYTTWDNYSNSIQCNNNICVVYNARFGNLNSFTYEWKSSNSPTCSGNAVVSGKFETRNTGFGINNNDYNYVKVYIVHNNQQIACSSVVNSDYTNFVCNTPSLSSDFSIGYVLNNTFGSQTSLDSFVYRDFDINCDTSTGQIIDNQNANTQSIINNNNQNTQDIINNNSNNTNNIINNNNQNTDEIINNNNENTDKEIESQKVCKNNRIDINSTVQNGLINSSGSVVSTSAWRVTDFLPVSSTSTIKVLQDLPAGFNSYLCFYKSDKSVISCIENSTLTANSSLTIPSNSSFVRFSIFSSSNLPTFDFYTCSNGNQAISDGLGDLNSNITDDTAPNVDLDLSVSSNTPISDLITMPLTILNSLVNTLDGTCSNYTIPFLFNTTLTFPCFTISDYLSNNITNYIDLFICLYMCYEIGMLVISIFEDITSLRDIYVGLYQPRHADSGYQPRHAKGGAN